MKGADHDRSPPPADASRNMAKAIRMLEIFASVGVEAVADAEIKALTRSLILGSYQR